MTETDHENMSPGLTAFVCAFMGAILLIFGFVASLVFWPAGMVMMALGALALIGSPVVGLTMWWGGRQEAS